MGNKNIKIENNGNRITLRYELIPGEELDENVLERLRNNFLESVAPIQYSESGTVRAVYSQMPVATDLASFLKRTLSKGQVLTILKNLVASLDIGKNGIPVSYIVKELNNIFIDEQSLDISVFVVPVKGQPLDVSEIPAFLKYFISNISFNENDWRRDRFFE